jgi:hypothetical protein
LSNPDGLGGTSLPANVGGADRGAAVGGTYFNGILLLYAAANSYST